ncbi:MAG: hypothetical protein ACOH1Y_00825 [Propionicimonas sp.]
MIDRKLLGVAMAVAVLFATGWLWRAAYDDVSDRALVSDGATATVKGVDYRLRSLTSSDRVTTSSDRPLVAVSGAVLVLAEVDYDSTGAGGSVFCSFELVAGETTWDQEFGYFPPDDGSVSCDPGKTGTVSALFEVPRALLAQVQGVGVINTDGTEPILPGRPG